MNGQKQLTSVRIEPDVFKSKDQEMLQELVLAAVNEATRRVDEELSKQVKDLTGGYPRPDGHENSRTVLSRMARAPDFCCRRRKFSRSDLLSLTILDFVPATLCK